MQLVWQTSTRHNSIGPMMTVVMWPDVYGNLGLRSPRQICCLGIVLCKKLWKNKTTKKTPPDNRKATGKTSKPDCLQLCLVHTSIHKLSNMKHYRPLGMTIAQFQVSEYQSFTVWKITTMNKTTTFSNVLLLSTSKYNNVDDNSKVRLSKWQKQWRGT